MSDNAPVAIIYCDFLYLVQIKDQLHPWGESGKISLFGGKQEINENRSEALFRELEEELGFDTNLAFTQSLRWAIDLNSIHAEKRAVFAQDENGYSWIWYPLDMEWPAEWPILLQAKCEEGAMAWMPYQSLSKLVDLELTGKYPRIFLPGIAQVLKNHFDLRFK